VARRPQHVQKASRIRQRAVEACEIDARLAAGVRQRAPGRAQMVQGARLGRRQRGQMHAATHATERPVARSGGLQQAREPRLAGEALGLVGADLHAGHPLTPS
jgi:hypothetical protein